MVETVGGTGFLTTRNPDFKPGIKNPLDYLRDAAEKRRIVKEEIRKKELEEKGENGRLTTPEAIELSSYKMEEALEKLAFLKPHTVCYSA